LYSFEINKTIVWILLVSFHVLEKPNQSICILSFSTISKDARVLRQVKYLAEIYPLTVIGYGNSHPSWERMRITWSPVVKESSLTRKGFSLLWLAGAKISVGAYERWYWSFAHHRQALDRAVAAKCKVYHANDVEALPVAAEAARQNHAYLILDAHEYAPLEFENRWYWRLYQPATVYLLRKYASQIAVFTTVCSPLAERYHKEFNLDAQVIMSAPERVDLPVVNREATDIQLIHHGGTIPDRKLEIMIEAMRYCDERFRLNFMLTQHDSPYGRYLKRLAGNIAADRIFFHEPVPPSEIVKRISQYDLGLCIIAPTNYNYRMSLPNKFFDFIAAGLGLCIGPSPAMAEIVNAYGVGCVSPSFSPRDIAATLNGLTAEKIQMMKDAARKSAMTFNADVEMGKLIAAYNKLLT
jgi:hypothetical protein